MCISSANAAVADFNCSSNGNHDNDEYYFGHALTAANIQLDFLCHFGVGQWALPS